jgi:hypothetical protein
VLGDALGGAILASGVPTFQNDQNLLLALDYMFLEPHKLYLRSKQRLAVGVIA